MSPTGWSRQRPRSDRPFAVALSGGSTPRRLYELLAGPPYREAFPWARTHWFWGDERFVPHDSPESNYRMVREAMLARAPVPAGNVHPVPTEGLTPQAAALSYEQELKTFYGAATLSPTGLCSMSPSSASAPKVISPRCSPARQS